MSFQDENVYAAIRTFTQEGFSHVVNDENDGVGVIVWDDPSKSDLPTYEQIKAKAIELSSDNAKNALRQTRNELIERTDWRANSDLTMSDEWKEYRKALRDITSTVTDDAVRQAMADNRNHSSWPTQP